MNTVENPLLTPTPAGSENTTARLPLAVLLDRLIVVLMVAILLTLSWPVMRVFWSGARSAPTPPAASRPMHFSLPENAHPSPVSQLSLYLSPAITDRAS